MKRVNLSKVASSLVVTMTAFALFTTATFAGRVKDLEDLMSDSGDSQVSDHTISFSATNGVAAGETINVLFDDSGDAFDLTGVVLGDIDLNTGTCGAETDQPLAATASGATWGVTINSTTDEILFTSGTATVANDDCVVIEIGTVAASGTNQITNPASTGLYDVEIATTQDSGKTKVAIVEHVGADVTVDETMTFTISGQTTAQCATTTDVNTTATNISFGTAAANTFYDACQEVYIETNAASGYNVTLTQTQLLTSGTDTIAEGTCDGGCSDTTEAAWATATNNGFGYCLENITGTDASPTNDCAAGTPGFKTFTIHGTDTPEVIMTNTGVTSGSAAEVGYRISVDAAQPAGFYQNELIYVATAKY